MKARILKRLEEEVAGLERELRTELPKEIQRARELGDLSENAEHQAAKERQSYLHARVGMIRKRMAEISLMNLTASDRPGRVRVDREAPRGRQRIAGDLPTGDARGRGRHEGLISTSSPIGKAIVGKQAGDEITVPTPTGVRRFEMISLSTVHDE
jgi:transcription elongation factor GreA